jgi:hypothetical protein
MRCRLRAGQRGVLTQGRPAGGEREVGGQRRQLLDEQRQVGPHRRLATGEADAVDPVLLDEQTGEPLDLLEGEDLLAGQPLHALFGHAVRAPEVAAVGDREAQVAVHAPVRIDQRPGH